MSERRKSVKKKRKPPWILGGVVLILFICLLLLQTSNVWKSFTVASATETLILYALSSLNFIAFIIFAFILGRSLLKLRQERKAFQLGSKIKTRLLVYFVAVSILPLIAMAIFSYWFMNRAVERWFTQIPENTVNRVKQVRSKTIDEQRAKLKKMAPLLAEVLNERPITNADLDDFVKAGDLSKIEIYSSDNKLIASAQNKVLADAQSTKRVEIATAKLKDGRSIGVSMNLPDSDEIEQMANSSLIELDSLKQSNLFVRQIGITTLGLLTFLLIFASSWTAFYIGKNLTRPIRALAEGADEIAKGNLSHRVDTFAEDELELLVRAFNGMSAKLEESSAELVERRKYTETVLQSLSAGVISFDNENRITTINKAAIRMLRLEKSDFTNLELARVINEENREVFEKLISRAKRMGQASEQRSLQREKANGSKDSDDNLPVALLVAALPDDGGAVLVLEDLSELIAAQRASAWQEVARRMAHEIKNPLTPIQLSAERIAKQVKQQVSEVGTQSKLQNGNEDKKTRKLVKEGTETILREVSSLKSMVDEFSRYARLPKPKLELEDLNKVITQAKSLYGDRDDDVVFKLDLADDLPNLQIDAEQIKRVFVNLIDNSYEAFSGIGTEKQIAIKTFHDAAKDMIVTEITDSGEGIDLANIRRLFQPYFSTKGRGTGLGLAIVQRTITEHGGKIKAVANTPKGAKFIVELPTNV